MKPPDNDDDDDPFGHLVVDVEQPSFSLEKDGDDEHDGNSSDADADNVVIVEDASTDEEEGGKDEHDNLVMNDEVKRSFDVQELFPTSVPIAIAADNDDEGSVSTSSHFNPTDPGDDVVQPHADVQNLTSIDSPASECDAIDFNAGSATQQADDPVAAPIVAPTESMMSSPIDKGDADNIDDQDQEADEMLLTFDDEAVVSEHQSYPLQINPLQQEQSPQQHELVQENLLDIPLSSYDPRSGS